MQTSFTVKFRLGDAVVFDRVVMVFTRREAWEQVRATHGQDIEPLAIEHAESDGPLFLEWQKAETP